MKLEETAMDDFNGFGLGWGLGEIMFKWWHRWRAGKIKDEVKREKTLANIDNEPWVKVVDVQFEDPKNPGSGFFELDWNQAFVQKLTDAGYSGREDSDIVDQWFNDLCRGVAGDRN